ncbi:hypothetical protein GF354_02960 [Candidatus Peregrinibacteria bacterium]|nr:hypothetical protein [Candidatus Peregrinibacteria bacterium]
MKNMKSLKQSLFAMALMVGAISLFAFLPTASAQLISPGDLPSEIGAATGGETDLRALVLRIINYFLTFLGIVAVIFVIYGGVTYVTSAGNDEAVGNAKKIIMYALIGIIVILLSFVLVNAILGAGLGGGA